MGLPCPRSLVMLGQWLALAGDQRVAGERAQAFMAPAPSQGLRSGRSPSPIAPALPRFQSLSPLLPSPLQAAGDTVSSSCSPPVLHQVLLVFLNSSAIKCYSIALLGAPCDCRQAPNHRTSQSLLPKVSACPSTCQPLHWNPNSFPSFFPLFLTLQIQSSQSFSLVSLVFFSL